MGVKHEGKEREAEESKKERHWSIEEAAHQIGISRTTYLRWEHYGQTPHDSSIAMACKAFNMSDEQLGLDTPTSTSPVNISKDQEEQKPAPQQVATLTPEQIVIFFELAGDIEMDLSKRNMLLELSGITESTDTQPGTDQKSISRRQILAILVATTAAAFGIIKTRRPQLHPEEILLLCGSNVPLLWQLYFEGGLKEVNHILPPYLTQLSTLAQQPAYYQTRAAAFASQGYQLSALLAILFHNMGTALDHAKKGIEYAQITDDPNLKTAAYIRLGVVQSTLKRPLQRLQAYENALQYSNQTSPLLQARTFAGLTETYSTLGNYKQALWLLDKTQSAAPTDYESDPNFTYTHFDAWSILQYEKDMHINIGNIKDAWATLERADKIVEQGNTPNRIHLTLKQAEVSLLQNEFERSYEHLVTALHGAQAIGSQLMLEDAHTIYMNMRQQQPGEKKVLRLEEHFRNI